ncbi:unnamed protein product [Ectocarpus sp. 6 AP-2014]
MPSVVFPRFERPVKAVYPVPSEDLPHLGESHSFKTMAIWNRKGGVAKTTITHSLGFALALKGKRVLLVDADPQCDLSYLLLKEWVKKKQTSEETEAGEENYDLFFNHQVPGRPNMKNNIKDALRPVLEPAGSDSPMVQWGPADVTKIPLPKGCQGGLFLLPGHEGLVDYEQKVTVAYGTNLLVEAIAPGAWNKLMALTARSCGADIVLVDCNPHRGKLNMHIILTSDYLFLPCTPDTYCHNAIKALPFIMADWVTTRFNARNTASHAGLARDVQIPAGNPRILGISVNRYTHINGKPAKNFSYWMTRIENQLREISQDMHKIPGLAGMAGTPGQPDTWPSILARVPEFNQFSALSHFYGLPVIALGANLMGVWNEEHAEMLKFTGNPRRDMSNKVIFFQGVFKKFLEEIGRKVQSGPLLVAFDEIDDVPGRPNMKNNIKDALRPVLEPAGSDSPMVQWGPADVTKIPLPKGCQGGLFLLPGHEGLVDYEQKVTVAYGTNLLVEAIAPGAWNKLMALTARSCGADIVLVDCNPHRGKLNMHIILTSDYLFLPCTPDTYCHNAIKALPFIMADWVTTRFNARNTASHAGLARDVQIPAGNPRILGISVNRYTHIKSKPAKNFSYWMTRIENQLREISQDMHKIPGLAGMAGTPGQPDTWPSILAKVPEFNQFSALSHFYGLPVIALGANLMGVWNEEHAEMQKFTGNPRRDMNKKVDFFQGVFKKFLEEIGRKVQSGPLLVAFDEIDDDESNHGSSGGAGPNDASQDVVYVGGSGSSARAAGGGSSSRGGRSAGGGSRGGRNGRGGSTNRGRGTNQGRGAAASNMTPLSGNKRGRIERPEY